MSEYQISNENQIPKVNEIQLSDILNFIKKYAVQVMLTGFLCGVLGYGLSFLIPKTYKSSAVLLPESGSSANGMGSLSGLARLSGISKNEGGGALQPELYPAVLQTVPFALYILNQGVTDEHNQSYKSLENFLSQKANTGFLSKQVRSSATAIEKSKQNFKSGEIISLSKTEDRRTKQVLALVTTVYDIKTGTISVEAEMPDPLVAAQTVNTATKYLIQYVSDYRTEKIVQEVQFLEERVIEAKKREQTAEYALQNYRDRNRSAFLNVARIEEQRLQADYVLSQALYSDLVRKWEDAKIKVKQEQPVIKILEPAKVPNDKSKPRRLIIAILFSFIATVFAVAYVVITKEKWIKNPSSH